ncbi:MAG: hypothetical protein K8F54_12030 [Altibacter sp.]|uniref:hypothetical protein n=1 Tax=Altibacter sp. TaxID=2024823 RepID=UPI001DE8C943|nr:hypothetical protein [Altibacter sp.]MBZ0328329.1 hypothetical protein [Altibacter sp.]
MKLRYSMVLMVFCTTLLAQPDTDIFLMDMAPSEAGLTISNFRNISNNPGYDSQPSFALGLLVYAGTHEGQTEIKAYQLESGTISIKNKMTSGGEYSPQLAADGEGFTAVRLDTTGLQRLYYYDQAGESHLMLKDLQVAYYTFNDKNTLLASVLSDDRMDLVLADLQNKKIDTLLHNSGRSIHKVPNSNAMSYTVLNEQGNYDIYQLDLDNRESYFITELPIGIQDYCWVSDSKLLLGSNDKLFVYDLFGRREWNLAADLSPYKIKEITRVSVNKDETKLAIAAETTNE